MLLVGFNEERSLPTAISSLQKSEYPVAEIIVIDDGSDDAMYQVARRFAATDPRIRVYRNTGACGRGGRPSGSNFGLTAARHDLIVSVDADTAVAPECIGRMLSPFADPAVGAVAGGLIVDRQQGLLASCQAIEYLVAFGLHRCWLDDHDMVVMASGALGAFRRSALAGVGGWDAELAEDADLSTKVRKAGWRIRFVPDALACTEVPQSWGSLLRQRNRWDRGFVRTFLRKHQDILLPWRYGWRRSVELVMEAFLAVLCGLLLPLYILWLGLVDLPLLCFVLLASMVIYGGVVALSLAVALHLTRRWRQDWPLLLLTPLYPVYGWVLRGMRLWAYLLELGRVDYEDPFLPASAWRNAPRW